MKTLSAEELLANNIDGLKDVMLPDTEDIFEFYKGVVCEFAKDFAWQHVQKALEKAFLKGQVLSVSPYPFLKTKHIIDKESILNAYTENDII